MLFFWKLPAGDVAEASQVVERLRLKATELRWEPTSEVMHLADDGVHDHRLDQKFLVIGAGDTCLVPHEVIFFTAVPPGDERRPFGLAAYPGHIESESQVVPTHLSRWCWVGVIRSQDLEAVRKFLKEASDFGLEVTSS